MCHCLCILSAPSWEQCLWQCHQSCSHLGLSAFLDKICLWQGGASCSCLPSVSLVLSSAAGLEDANLALVHRGHCASGSLCPGAPQAMQQRCALAGWETLQPPEIVDWHEVEHDCGTSLWWPCSCTTTTSTCVGSVPCAYSSAPSTDTGTVLLAEHTWSTLLPGGSGHDGGRSAVPYPVLPCGSSSNSLPCPTQGPP